MRRIISLILVAVILLGVMPQNVFATNAADSMAVTEESSPGKIISILGDSISTFKGYIPEGNATYYPANTVKNAADTWWMQLITELDAALGVNESWSGSYVSETAGDKLAMASVERIQNLGSNGTPDVIIFFGGTNDIAYKRPLGSFDPATAPEQADLTATAWDSLADGYVAAILRMQHYYPDAQIVSILPTINRSYYNNATLEQHNAVLRAICTHYGVEYVDLVAAGFTASMLGDATHPNAVGMDFITAAVKEKLQAEHSHVYTAVVTEPTCAAQGYTTHTCDCGDSYVDSYVDATGKHDYHRGHCAVCGNDTALQGKTFSILGDSISTYTNISNNTQYNATIGNNKVYYTAGKLGVYQADTWWQQAIDQFGLELLVNNSWSGSQVWGTGAQAQPAYIDRCVQLHNIEGKTPDIIAVYLGTNDFTVSKSKLGTADEIDYDTLISHNGSEFVYAAPATVCESYAIMLHKIAQRYPDAEVYCFTLLPRINQSVAHVQLAEGLNESIAQIAREFGAIVVDLYHDSGIRADSYFKTFVADNSLHPGPAGMDAITGCFTSAVLKNSNYFGGTAYDVSYALNNVTVSEGTANAVEGDKSFSCSLIVPAGYESVVTVTMGGADITASCYHDGKIMVDRVTGDMVITAEAKLPEVAPSDYRWEYDGADLVAADGSNALTRLAGSIKNGVHTAGQYQLQKKIYLLHHRPWAIEWKSTGTWAGRTNGSGVLLFAEGKASNTSNGAYLYRRPGTDFIGLGYYDGTYRNYGVVLSGRGIDLSEEHTYLMENRIAADGTNMVWLLIDGVEMGPMNQYYEGGTNKNTTSDWVAGKDFSFSYMGTSSHPLGDCSIDYVQIWENGRPAHTHSYEATVTDPTCTEQGYTTYTCDCGDSYVDDYLDPTGEHSYENGICTGCGADEPETPKDCSEGHQFGDWSEDTSAACRKHYVRECLVCGESQQAKDISEQTIPFAVPAITANVGDLVNLSLYSVAFTAASVIPAAELTWTGEAVENGCVIPDASGVYALTASAGESSKTVYLVVKNPGDTEYVLYFDDFDNAQLDGYRAIEVPSGAKYSVSDGNLILDAGTNSNNHMRILLPEWIGAFGDYEITTRFSMLSAVQSSYWFATMARVQNEDYPYWQAAIRQNASASNGVEISTRTKASGASGGWTVTHKTALDENLSASKYYTQTFGLSGTNGFHAINDTILLESDAITNMVGDVGFHLRASKVAVDSIKIVIPSDDYDHNFDTWTVTREASCTEAGEESRTCSQCGATEYREIEAGHSLTKYAHKLPTCTEPGWKAYESCSRCDYTTYVEFPAVGHTFERDIHSVAHRGYSDVAPENTLIAYTMAKEQGFRYVECDISLTADRRAVLLHDDTINRTSNGTGKITSLTYEQLLQYDFGSWKGEEFAGTKIPTLEEFLGLCMELELHPYIELKTSGYTKAEIASLVQLVEACGLLDNCTWISFNATYLGYVKAADPTARLGYLRNDDATNTVINTAKSLRTISNEVFLDLAYGKLTEAGLLLAKENGFEVEVWTVDDEDIVKSLPASIIGFTSNMLAAEEILKNAQVTLPTCTEQGYTTYTCTCGESYVDDYVDATGEHRYENGVCVDCGAAQPQPIIITRQPVPAAAVIGEKATVFVEAAGEGLSYQWYYRDDCNADFTRSTVRGNTYTLTVKAANAARELYCVITDAQGNQVTTDTVKMLQPLAEELKIITQPASAYALIGEKATVTMEVQGIGLTYQWYYRDLPGGSLTKSTITTADYSITVKPTYVNRELYCVITDAHGNQVTTDTVKMLEPLRESLEITKQPVSSTAAIGETAAVSVEAKGEGLTYQWYFRNTPSGAPSKSSITGNSYSVIVSKSNAQRVVYCVITDGHGNKVTTETVALRTDAPAEEPKIYFASLSDALAGIDGSAAPEGAVVRVDKDSDETVITLLGDTSLTESLTVTEDVVLDLNGFTVSSEIFPMIHVKSGICSLQNGSILLSSDGSGTTSAPAVAITVDPGAGLQASKATVTVTDSANGTVIGIATAAGSTLVLNETDVTVTTGKSLDNVAINTKGKAILRDCSIIAEADYTGAGNAYTSSSRGIYSKGELELYNCYVWGAHSGVTATGKVYVDGGTYEGYGHGGFYLAAAGETSYFYNAAFQWAKMRTGTTADSIAGTNNVAFYIGADSNITAYFDNCSFKANDATKSYGIVFRSSGGESNNRAYVSNSSFKNYKKYAYRIGNAENTKNLYAYSGVNNTYSGRIFNYASKGFYTEASYAQMIAVKEASVMASATVNIGELVTYTLTITNHGYQAKTVAVTDVVPENSTYVSGGVCEDGLNIHWDDVTIPAGESVELSFTVQVNNDPDLYSEGVLSAATATVDGVEIPSYPIYIRRTLTENDAQYLKQAMLALHDSSYTSQTLLKWIYQVAYSKSPLITEDPCSTLHALYSQLDDANEALRNTVAPTLYGGTAVATDVDPYFPGKRASNVTEEAFITGDVLLCENNGSGRIYLYFDGFVELTNGMDQVDSDTVLTLANTAERYAVIRPSIAFPTVSASEGMTDPASLSAAEKALLVTAQNYLLRGERIQYDDSRLSSISGAEFRWKKGAVAPENYTSDEWGYTNCAAFCYDLYGYGIGLNLGSYTTSGLIGKTSWRKYFYEIPDTVSSTAAAEQKEKFASTLQFGDLIIIRRDNDGNGSDDSGHVMFYIGDGRVIHSTGSSYSYTTSVETYEPCMRYMDIFDYLFTPDSANYVFDTTVSKLAILRPLVGFKGQLTEESQNRANGLSGLRVEKLSSCKPSVSVNPGDEITFTFEILNANASAKNITITDILPENTEFVSVIGGSCSNGSLSFSVTVGAYQTATVSYTVRVKEGSYAKDAKISGDSAKANGVSLACHEISIRNTLTADEQARIKEAIAYYRGDNSEKLSGIPLINAIYRRAGLEAPFGDEETFATVANGVVEKYTSKAVRIAENGSYRPMLVDGLFGGRYLYTAELAFLSGGDRVRLPREQNLVPGDIILGKTSTSELFYIYDGEYTYGITTAEFKQEDPGYRLERLMAFQHYFVILRPSFVNA